MAKRAKKLRRLMLMASLFLAVVSLSLLASTWWLSHKEPDWYQPTIASPQELAEASDRAEKQIEKTLNWAQNQQASAKRASTTQSTTLPAASTDIAFSETELNGFFRKWDVAFGWSNAYSNYVSDPIIVIRDGELILAARVKELGAVVSIETRPRLENGKLMLSVERVSAGRLPLPRTVWGRYTAVLSRMVEANLDAWRDEAMITPGNGANSAAAAAAMGELAVDALHDKSAPPVLFLPDAFSGGSRSLPVQITELTLADRTLSMTVRPLTSDEQAALLAKIRESGAVVSAQ